MKKILFGITCLNTGGAERTLVDLVNALKDTYEITILTLYGKGELEKEVSSKVEIFSIFPNAYSEYSKKERLHISFLLTKKSFQANILKLYQISSFDRVIAFLEGPMTHLFSRKELHPIAWIHTDMSVHEVKGVKGKLKAKRNLKDYANYESLVFVNEKNRASFFRVYPIKKNSYVIPNYIDEKRIQKLAKEAVEEKFESPSFLTVARLVIAKRIDRLVKVHAKLLKDGYKHHCYIVGDGEEREKVEALIKEYKVGKTFHLIGRKENPYPYMKMCDYFLLPSDYEGAPITLYEAKLLKKYILITDNDSKEVVKDYTSKQIFFNSEEGIYEGMKKVIEEKPKYVDSIESHQSLDPILSLLEGSYED